ncbi:MAG: transglutaminase domain-containing protein [Bacilli bacterium]|nr:transglutaminase domain-containing protein [Bacilli bacterium]
MNKKNKYGKAILVTGFIAIVVVTICAFQKDKIVYKYYEYTIDKKYSKININDYYKDDNFNYVDDYTESGIKNRNDLINSIYYAINSGTDYIERYIDSDYTNYINDINTLTAYNGAEFKKVISTLNNFVHPYNSSNNVKISYGGDYKIGITINRAYTQDEINEINNKVDKILNENVNNNMPPKEKIRAIHDYIIDHTEYDKLKYENKNDDTYKSNTAYGVLIEGYGTCNGYADAMEIFLDKMNIINYKISNEEHIWNLVYLDGKWYHLDLTWDDPISDININRDTYFLISTKTLEKINDGTHTFDKNIYSEAV